MPALRDVHILHTDAATAVVVGVVRGLLGEPARREVYGLDGDAVGVEVGRVTGGR